VPPEPSPLPRHILARPCRAVRCARPAMSRAAVGPQSDLVPVYAARTCASTWRVLSWLLDVDLEPLRRIYFSRPNLGPPQRLGNPCHSPFLAAHLDCLSATLNARPQVQILTGRCEACVLPSAQLPTMMNFVHATTLFLPSMVLAIANISIATNRGGSGEC